MLFDVGLARSVYSMQVRPGVASSGAVSDATQTLAKPRLRFCAGVKTRPTLLTPSCATVTAAIETTAPSTSQTDNSPAAIRGPTSSCPLGRAPASAQNRSDQSRSSGIVVCGQPKSTGDARGDAHRIGNVQTLAHGRRGVRAAKLR